MSKHNAGWGIWISREGYPDCCAIDVLCGFPDTMEAYNADNEREPVPKLAASDWLEILGRAGVAGPIYSFANSSSKKDGFGGNNGECTPKKLATWLRSLGEKVTAGASAVNPDSGNTITPYFWAPSKKFRTKLNNYNKKKTTKNAERGAQAA